MLKKIYQNPNSEVNYELPLSDQSFENISAYSDNFSCPTFETTSGELVSQTIIIPPDVTHSNKITDLPPEIVDTFSLTPSNSSTETAVIAAVTAPQECNESVVPDIGTLGIQTCDQSASVTPNDSENSKKLKEIMHKNYVKQCH